MLLKIPEDVFMTPVWHFLASLHLLSVVFCKNDEIIYIWIKHNNVTPTVKNVPRSGRDEKPLFKLIKILMTPRMTPLPQKAEI